MKDYSAIKMSELLIYGTTWMNIKGIMLSERCCTPKNNILYDTQNSEKANYWLPGSKKAEVKDYDGT